MIWHTAGWVEEYQSQLRATINLSPSAGILLDYHVFVRWLALLPSRWHKRSFHCLFHLHYMEDFQRTHTKRSRGEKNLSSRCDGVFSFGAKTKKINGTKIQIFSKLDFHCSSEDRNTPYRIINTAENIQFTEDEWMDGTCTSVQYYAEITLPMLSNTNICL